MNTSIRYFLGWVFVRPRRWFFGNMLSHGSFGIQWLPKRREWNNSIRWPNLHWWLLYKTVFRFCMWLCWNAWRPLCTWKDRRLYYKPWYAEAIHRLGETTAGFHSFGGECFHCGSKHGNPVDLAEPDSGYFELQECWTNYIPGEGTDHRFRGITTCPMCGHQEEYEDGSL